MEHKKPNILFILTDDQGAWAMGCAGNTDIYTPNLDRLAARGFRFENFFCASPVCSPARASLLTGRIPSAHGVQDWIRSGNLDKDKLDKVISESPYYTYEEKAIPYLEGMLTYTDVLKENGYTCALSGKWHLGDSLTPQHGFDKWFTIGRGGCYYDNADIVENGKVTFSSQYITNVITDKALSYLEEFQNQENPFYLSVHYTAPHSPWDENQHPAEYIERYRDCGFTATPDLPVHPNQIPSAPYGTGEIRKSLLRGYYAAITAMDADVGRLLDRLETLGLHEDTIVMFMSDNGMNWDITESGEKETEPSPSTCMIRREKFRFWYPGLVITLPVPSHTGCAASMTFSRRCWTWPALKENSPKAFPAGALRMFSPEIRRMTEPW